jgi:hypothetical protein
MWSSCTYITKSILYYVSFVVKRIFKSNNFLPDRVHTIKPKSDMKRCSMRNSSLWALLR